LSFFIACFSAMQGLHSVANSQLPLRFTSFGKPFAVAVFAQFGHFAMKTRTMVALAGKNLSVRVVPPLS